MLYLGYHFFSDNVKDLVQIMLPRVFTLFYPSANSEFESIMTARLLIICLRFHCRVAILSHLTAPPFLELLVILDDDVFRVEFSEGILEVGVIGEVAEQFDSCALCTIATKEDGCYIRADILAEFFTTTFNHQIIAHIVLHEECHICFFCSIHEVETVQGWRKGLHRLIDMLQSVSPGIRAEDLIDLIQTWVSLKESLFTLR